jgi:hypothetical protein
VNQLAKHRLAVVVAIIGFALPTVAYFWSIHSFAVNVPHGDQWSDIQIINDSYSGHLSIGQLWAQHNENRIFFPNLIVLLLGRTAHFNIVFEEYVGGLLLVVSVGLLIVAHRRRAGRIEWVFYCPVAILMLSLVQYQNALWGFQMAWYLVLFSVAVTLYLLDRPSLTWPVLAISIASGVVASFSSLQGLLVWPIGLYLLYFRHRPRVVLIAWIASAAVTAAVYFADFSTKTAGSSTYAFHHPLAAVAFYFVAVGDIVGANITGADTLSTAVLCLGLLIVATSIWTLTVFCSRPNDKSGTPIAAALICFGLLFAATVTDGRTVGGLASAGQSRYTTFDLLIVVGLYLVLLEQFATGLTAHRMSGSSEGLHRQVHVSGVRDGPLSRNSIRRSRPILAALIVAIVCLQVGIGIPTGLSGARTYHAGQVFDARVLVNINHYPDKFVVSSLGEFESATFIRQMTRVLTSHRLSLFAGDGAARYRAAGLVPLPPPTARIARPIADAMLRGKPLLVATVTDDFDVTKVEFEATGQGLANALISPAAPFPYGWIGVWDTTKLPDGSYVLESIAFDSAGNEIHSPGIPVVVKNH